MNKRSRKIAIIILIFSPLWVGALATQNEPADSVAGLVVFLGLIVGSPIVAVCGFVFSFLTRKSANAAILSLIGYLIAAIFVCGYMVTVNLS